MNTVQAAAPKVRPIRFQPALPQPAHPGRSLLAWGIPTAFLEILAVAGLVAITARPDIVERVVPTLVRIVETPSEVSLPEPPPPPPLPATAQPVAMATAIPEVAGFQELAMPTVILKEIPPPVVGALALDARDFTGEGIVGGRGVVSPQHEAPLDAAPVFTPYTVAPFLRNSQEVARTLAREYPPQLRSAAIGGQVLLWLFIDENGRVQRTEVKESSGFAALDSAAARVAMVMEFSPAINRDRKVPVWVAVPVEFNVT